MPEYDCAGVGDLARRRKHPHARLIHIVDLNIWMHDALTDAQQTRRAEGMVTDGSEREERLG
jgi:hypothetical protein